MRLRSLPFITNKSHCNFLRAAPHTPINVRTVKECENEIAILRRSSGEEEEEETSNWTLAVISHFVIHGN